jgi:hypothetical protein
VEAVADQETNRCGRRRDARDDVDVLSFDVKLGESTAVVAGIPPHGLNCMFEMYCYLLDFRSRARERLTHSRELTRANPPRIVATRPPLAHRMTIWSARGTIRAMSTSDQRPSDPPGTRHHLRPSGCKSVSVGRQVCYITFVEGTPHHSDELTFHTARGEVLIADFDAEGRIMGIELVGPNKPCQQ